MLLPLVKEMITKGEGDSCAASHFLAIVHQRIKDLGIKPLLTLLRPLVFPFQCWDGYNHCFHQPSWK